MICKICGRECKSFLSLAIHLSKTHHEIKNEDYYLKYLSDNANAGKCVNCGKTCNFISLSLGFHKYCSHDCQAKSAITKEKAKRTKFMHFGEGKYFSDAGIEGISKSNRENAETRVAKLKETNLKKYNTAWPTQNTNIKEKVAKTNLAKYGNKCSLHGSNQENTELCMIEKLGVKNPLQNQDIKNKVMETNKNRRGVAWPWASKECIEKRKQNYFEKTGYNYPGQNPEVRRKSVKHYEYDNQRFDSSWELAYFIWLKDHNIPFEYQCGKLQYEYNGQTKTYFPDFYVNGQYVEIKGPQFFENGKMINPWDRSQDGLFEAKHQCMLANNVKIITDCSSYLKYLEDVYGKDCLSKFDLNNAI